MKETNWDSIIADLRRGNNEALRTFFEEHSTYCITKLTKENMCSKENAEDIFVDSVMNFREKLVEGKIEMVLNIRAYLYKTCYNMFLVRLRQKQKKENLSDELEKFYYDSDYQSEDTEDFTEKLNEITMQAWGFLTERCKDILSYFYVDRLRMKEIANLMGLSSSDVAKATKSRCYKAMVEKALELKREKELVSANK